jgi:saccharopine dehydrogenase (NAD+, L-glutamate forming)
MLAQTALSLACDDLPATYGVLTPGGLMGDALLARLPRIGVRFDVRSS